MMNFNASTPPLNNTMARRTPGNRPKSRTKRRGFKSRVNVSGSNQQSVKKFKTLQRRSPSRKVDSPTQGTKSAVNPLSSNRDLMTTTRKQAVTRSPQRGGVTQNLSPHRGQANELIHPDVRQQNFGQNSTAGVEIRGQPKRVTAPASNYSTNNLVYDSRITDPNREKLANYYGQKKNVELARIENERRQASRSPGQRPSLRRSPTRTRVTPQPNASQHPPRYPQSAKQFVPYKQQSPTMRPVTTLRRNPSSAYHNVPAGYNQSGVTPFNNGQALSNQNRALRSSRSPSRASIRQSPSRVQASPSRVIANPSPQRVVAASPSQRRVVASPYRSVVKTETGLSNMNSTQGIYGNALKAQEAPQGRYNLVRSPSASPTRGLRKSPSRVIVDANGNTALVQDHLYNLEIQTPLTSRPEGSTIDKDGNIVLPPIVKPPIYVDHLGRTLNNNLPTPQAQSPYQNVQAIPPVQTMTRQPSQQRNGWGYMNPEVEFNRKRSTRQLHASPSSGFFAPMNPSRRSVSGAKVPSLNLTSSSQDRISPRNSSGRMSPHHASPDRVIASPTIVPGFRTNPIKAYKGPIDKAPLQNPILVNQGPVPIKNKEDNYVPPRSYKAPQIMAVKMPQGRLRMLKEVNTLEMSDIDIGNKRDFFKFNRPAGSVDLLESKLFSPEPTNFNHIQAHQTN